MNERPKHDGIPLMSLSEAAAWGITHLRDPKWVNPMDHVEIAIIDGKVGPWVKLFCPDNKGLNGTDPVQYLSFSPPGPINIEAVGLVPYHGPRHDDAVYQAEVAKRCEMWAEQEKRNG